MQPLLLTDTGGQIWQVNATDAGSYTLDEVGVGGQASVLLEDAETGRFWNLFVVITAGNGRALEVSEAFSGTPVSVTLLSPTGLTWKLLIIDGAISTLQVLAPTSIHSMLLPGIYTQLTATTAAAAVQKLLAQSPADAVFISLAGKGAARPYLVLDLVAAPPAEASLDGISDLREGEIQFDSYADSAQAARALITATRDYFMKTFNAGALPDGTTIQFVDVTVDHDEPFETGGTGYLFRSLLRLKAFYTEAP